MNDAPNLIAINVGNTRTLAGVFVGGTLEETVREPNDDLPALVKRVTPWWDRIRTLPQAVFMLASVNDDAANRVAATVSGQFATEVYRVGTDLPVPIGEQLDPETITGVDRLLNAAAAFAVIEQACIVIDAGTAVTVDFVDGEGTFHGGAIAPGARMQLRAMHEHTAALPDVPFEVPDDDPFGRSTARAMQRGVYQGIRGLVWRLVEQYAEYYGAYPMVIATGGDAEVLFADDALVDRIVPDLTLHGIATAARHALRVDDADLPK
ncbi:MAG: type III pantothenate kinase [Phycisphaerales bacterium]|nr:type III pantothenate kinase [Phycisphaerae bacterium]NNF44395.1 type III pantothenate kinase [Phycisphaerales bacterium]NNM27624.1 type III pantothenate kinase [Phycisphaerales bacterium]